MAKWFTPESTAVLAALLWCLLVLFVSRRYGVRWQFGRGLSEESAVVQAHPVRWIVTAGVLMFGCGLAIATTVNDYLSWKLWPAQYFPLTLRYLLIRLLVFAGYGAVIAAVLRKYFLKRLRSK